MNLMAGILKLPTKRILFAVSVPIALVELYLGLNWLLCLTSVAAMVLIPPWGLSSGLRRLAQKRLSDATPHYKMSDASRQAGDFDLAITESSKAIRIDRHNARAYTGRGNIYDLKGEHDLAITDYTTAIQIDPRLRGLAYRRLMGPEAGNYDLAWAYFDRGCAYREKGEDDLAKEDFESAISTGHSGFPMDLAYNELGMVYHTKGEYDSASDAIENAIRVNPSNAEYYNNRGLAHHASGEYDLAVRDFDNAISHAEDEVLSSDAYKNRRCTYEAKGEYQRAAADHVAENMLWGDAFDVEDSEEVVQSEIRSDVAGYFWRLGQHDLAIAHYTAAIELDPDEPRHFNNRGLVYLDKGEFDLAITDFETTIAMDPGGWVAFENRDRAQVAKHEFNSVGGEVAEPFNLRRRRLNHSLSDGPYFFTCARPGRSSGPKGDVPDAIVSQWVNGLPGPETVIISLLGHKKAGDGVSEYSYYTFHGQGDTAEERAGKPSFQEWLDHHHKGLGILVREYPTTDDLDDPTIPNDKVLAIARDVEHFVAEHRTVVVVDSGGVSRTGIVAKYFQATEAPRTDHGPGPSSGGQDC